MRRTDAWNGLKIMSFMSPTAQLRTRLFTDLEHDDDAVVDRRGLRVGHVADVVDLRELEGRHARGFRSDVARLAEQVNDEGELLPRERGEFLHHAL